MYKGHTDKTKRDRFEDGRGDGWSGEQCGGETETTVLNNNKERTRENK